jgi:hypothetical protein
VTKKTYAITAYYKDYYAFDQVEAKSMRRRQRLIALENQKDWERSR